MVEIQGLAGISVTEDRTQGFADELERKCPDGGIEIIASQPSAFNPDTGLKVMASTGRSSSRTNPSVPDAPGRRLNFRLIEPNR